MGTCGAGNGAEGVYHAFAEAIHNQGRDVKLASVGCFGFCAQEPLVNVRLPGRPLVILRRVQSSDVNRILDDIARGTLPEDLALCKIEEWDHLTAHMRLRHGISRTFPTGRKCRSSSRRRRSCCATAASSARTISKSTSPWADTSRLYKVLIDANPELVVEQIKAAKLRGRGGAGFLTGLKWEFLRKAVGEQQVHHLQRG